jgi:hypothetical protein
MRIWRMATVTASATLLSITSAFAQDQAPSPLAGKQIAHTPGRDPEAHPSDAAAQGAQGEETKNADPIQVTIEGEKPGSEAASRVSYGRRELELRPRLRPADVVEAVPGLFAVQHSGGGKANQYFLRGFDADHGTDVAFFVDDVPVNMVSHGHGQGFSDLHFLIPELVTSLDGYKGTYYANLGDFATAGAVNLHLAEKFEESYAQYSIGQYGIMRGLVIASPDLGDDWRVVMAAEMYKDDGPFVNPEDLKRYNIYLRATHDLSHNGKVSMTWMSYGSSWHGSGQIPARAVCGEGEQNGINPPPSAYNEPCISHFGYIDPTEGGDTQRHMLQLAYQTAWHDTDFQAMAYLIRYRFTLYSDFTFYAEDPIHGDEIEQNDDRTIVGVDTHVHRQFRYGGAKFTTTIGAQARFDSIETSLYHDQARVRLDTRIKAGISESEIGVYIEEDARLNRYLRFILGLRGQRIDVNVEDERQNIAPGDNGSGVKGAGLLLPKAMAVLSPIPQLDVFVDYGRGFHSNDARGVVLARNPATLMTPATGYEVGLRVKPIPEISLSAAGFLLDLDSELVWNGDEGTTSPSGRTRRYGVELDGRYHLMNWLFADIDATFTKARFRENAGDGQAVALAPTRTFTAGLGARPTIGDFTPFASMRMKSIGARPATQDESLIAEGFTVVDANAGVRWKNLELAADAQNVFNATWREVQFASVSRLPFEPKPVTGITYSPGWPRTIVGRATLYWQ